MMTYSSLPTRPTQWNNTPLSHYIAFSESECAVLSIRDVCSRGGAYGGVWAGFPLNSGLGWFTIDHWEKKTGLDFLVAEKCDAQAMWVRSADSLYSAYADFEFAVIRMHTCSCVARKSESLLCFAYAVKLRVPERSEVAGPVDLFEPWSTLESLWMDGWVWGEQDLTTPGLSASSLLYSIY